MDLDPAPARPLAHRGPQLERLPRGVDGQVRELLVHRARAGARLAGCARPARLAAASVSRTDSPRSTARRARATARPGRRRAAARGRGPRDSSPPAIRSEHLVGELQQPHRVGDRRAALADPPRDLGLARGRARRRARHTPAPARPGSDPRGRRSRPAPGSATRARRHGARSPGSSPSPAFCAARQRRSPAMISYPSPVSRTTIGCTTPSARDRLGQRRDRLLVERACAAGAGWAGSGRPRSRPATPCRRRPGTRPRAPPGPRPSPRALVWSATLDHLHRHAVVRVGAGGGRVVAGDRDAVARRLGQPHAARHHGVEHQRPEVRSAPRSRRRAASRVRASYIVSSTPVTPSRGLSRVRTSSTLCSSWASPSRA